MSRLLFSLFALFFIFIFSSNNAISQSKDTTILVAKVLVQFESDQSNLTSAFHSQIRTALAGLDTLNDLFVIIEAHTDDIGDVDYNFLLSKRRAETIQSYLLELDFDSSAISLDYFGEERQLDNNLNEKGRALNRRAEMRLYYKMELPDPVPEFNGVEFAGRTIDSRSGEGVESTVVVSGKEFETKTTSDSIGFFTVEVPEDAILKFQGYPKSLKYKPRMLMVKSTPEQLATGVIIELNGQELLKPQNLRTLSGVISDEFNEPLANAMLLVQGKTIKDSLFTDAEGRFEIEIPERETVRLSAYLKDYFYDQKLISPIENKHSESIKLELPAIEEGRRYVAGDILFVGNRDVVLPTSQIHLRSLKEVIRMADGYCFKIEGHINQPHSPPVSRQGKSFILSEDRAKRIYKFLKNNNIEDERICYEGFGNWRMAFPNAMSAKEQMLNRRVEVLVIPCEN